MQMKGEKSYQINSVLVIDITDILGKELTVLSLYLTTRAESQTRTRTDHYFIHTPVNVNTLILQTANILAKACRHNEEV